VTTLWPVEDAAARDWTLGFYAACIERGGSATEASEEAARALLQRRRSEGKCTHPFFWAAFIATGGCDEDLGRRK
jgi:CHAT domain-containing protein